MAVTSAPSCPGLSVAEQTGPGHSGDRGYGARYGGKFGGGDPLLGVSGATTQDIEVLSRIKRSTC